MVANGLTVTGRALRQNSGTLVLSDSSGNQVTFDSSGGLKKSQTKISNQILDLGELSYASDWLAPKRYLSPVPLIVVDVTDALSVFTSVIFAWRIDPLFSTQLVILH